MSPEQQRQRLELETDRVLSAVLEYLRIADQSPASQHVRVVLIACLVAIIDKRKA